MDAIAEDGWVEMDQMLHEFLSPVLSSALTYIVTAGLGLIGYGVRKIYKLAKSQNHTLDAHERAIKALMRSDLIERYKFCRDNGGWISGERLDRWLADYEVYHALAGANGYLDEMREAAIRLDREPNGNGAGNRE